MASEPSPEPLRPPDNTLLDASEIDLYVLSPSPEIKDGRIIFLKIPLETSVSTLKHQIQARVDSHPPPSRQRLIYRGRALMNGTAILQDVLRAEVCFRSMFLILYSSHGR